MSFEERILSEKEVVSLFEIEENHFNDFKSKDIEGKKLSRTISAFANASGGDVYVGIREENDTKIKHWEGLKTIEDANGLVQMISNLLVVTNNYEVVFLKHPVLATYVLQVTIFKTQSIVYCTDGKIPYVRKGAQNLPCDTPEKIRRLELDKGISSFENEVVAESDLSDVRDSIVWKMFKNNIVPDIDAEAWLKKQRLLVGDKLTIAALLFCSNICSMPISYFFHPVSVLFLFSSPLVLMPGCPDKQDMSPNNFLRYSNSPDTVSQPLKSKHFSSFSHPHMEESLQSQ